MGEIIETEVLTLIESINGLKVELSGFRSEMKEFKKIMNKRIDDLERKNMQCQGNPSFCANARRLDEHIKNDNGRLGRTLGIIGCVLSCISVGIVVVGKLIK
ncbi:hypothetical protein [Treponema sp.]|uniref:hypothetical protein n=1 Tax=Treponema sp. TaxID=166 RepID=UPI0027029203|nr:hypothetical protein [Treponema sp.]MCI6442798.1 hypothetical protein [Spirochaetia bacterium]MCQ2240453.1 hypothetical protein [Treponema sp.]MDO4507445.1 hypothetical protein [Spirochaetales bacterium]MDY4132870.1 hypothetical protein [Treponema sp.]